MSFPKAIMDSKTSQSTGCDMPEPPTSDLKNADTKVEKQDGTAQPPAEAKPAEGEKTADTSSEPTKMSKNHLKRLLKIEQSHDLKRRRKEQAMNVKIAKAKAAGRDRDAEREEMEENRKDGQGRAKRNDKWKENFEKNSSKYQICLDCSFEDMMTQKEINSLSIQTRYCYGGNKKAKHPVRATATSLGGKTLENLQRVSGFDHWQHRAFHHTKSGLLEAFPDKSKLVYLTSDSENVLDTLEDDKIYIIGGIVDRNRLKRAAIDRAEEQGIATAKLPISEYLSMVSTKVLTCNHVFDVLLKYRENGNDWKKAFLDVLPVRKDAKAKG
jgi:tRNA (guanine9-N1)-methyltransferase